MDAPEWPRVWHFTEHRQLGWVIVPAVSILLLLGAAWLGSVLFDDGADEAALGTSTDWTVPAIALSSMAVVPVVIGGALALGERYLERRLARRVVASAVAVCPQFATAQQWGSHAQRRADDDAASGDAIVWAIGVPTVIVAGIVVWAVVADAVVAVPALVAFWLLIVGLVIGRRWRLSVRVADDRRRRESLAPTPFTWVSDEGVYSEEAGLIRIDQVVAADRSRARISPSIGRRFER